MACISSVALSYMEARTTVPTVNIDHGKCQRKGACRFTYGLRVARVVAEEVLCEVVERLDRQHVLLALVLVPLVLIHGLEQVDDRYRTVHQGAPSADNHFNCIVVDHWQLAAPGTSTGIRCSITYSVSLSSSSEEEEEELLLRLSCATSACKNSCDAAASTSLILLCCCSCLLLPPAASKMATVLLIADGSLPPNRALFGTTTCKPYGIQIWYGRRTIHNTMHNARFGVNWALLSELFIIQFSPARLTVWRRWLRGSRCVHGTLHGCTQVLFRCVLRG